MYLINTHTKYQVCFDRTRIFRPGTSFVTNPQSFSEDNGQVHFS